MVRWLVYCYIIDGENGILGIRAEGLMRHPVAWHVLDTDDLTAGVTIESATESYSTINTHHVSQQALSVRLT